MIRKWGLALLASIPLVGGALAYKGFTFTFMVCPSRILVGVPCVTHGMTRSLRALYGGRVVESLAMNPITIPLVILSGVLLLLVLVDLTSGPNVMDWLSRPGPIMLFKLFLSYSLVVYGWMLGREWAEGILQLHYRNSYLGELLKAIVG